MKNTQKGFAPIIIALIVAVVLGGGYLMVKGYFTVAKVSIEEVPTPPETKAIIEAIIDELNETANWKIYSDGEFEIRYPQDWNIKNGSDPRKAGYAPSGILLYASFGSVNYEPEHDGDLFIWVYDKSFKSVEGFIKDMGNEFSDRQEKRKNITINGIPALNVVVTGSTVPSWVLEVVIIEKDSRIYFIQNQAFKNDLFSKIYGSFKFTSHPLDFIGNGLGLGFKESGFFNNPIISSRFTNLLGTKGYAELKTNWNVQTSITKEDNIYNASGCRQHDCPSYSVDVYFDVANDNINIAMFKDSDYHLYTEKGAIILPLGMQKNLDIGKQNSGVK